MAELTFDSDLYSNNFTSISEDHTINEYFSTTLYEDQSIVYLTEIEVSPSIKLYHTVEWIVSTCRFQLNNYIIVCILSFEKTDLLFIV